MRESRQRGFTSSHGGLDDAYDVTWLLDVQIGRDGKGVIWGPGT
ncbi:MAG: hypothetical protein QOJ42_382 [Acidobacteriaceae bacterium]|nr:hypothetical protein [Acidobacteriaceae bacterium]